MIKGKLYQGYNIKGELVYKFRNLEELDRYFNHVGYILATSLDGNFIKTKECFFYYEEATDEKIDKLISQLYIDKKLTGPILVDRLNYIKRLGFQITTDIMEQLNHGESNFSYAINVNPKEYMKKEEINVSENVVNALGGKDGGNYDDKGNSAHYESQFMPYVRQAERQYGTAIAYIVCLSQVDKYNQRAGQKEGVPAEKDLTKRDWYQKAAGHFKIKIEANFNNKPLVGRNFYVDMSEEIVDVIKKELTEVERNDYVPLSIAIEL